MKEGEGASRTRRVKEKKVSMAREGERGEIHTHPKELHVLFQVLVLVTRVRKDGSVSDPREGEGGRKGIERRDERYVQPLSEEVRLQ